MLVHIGGQNKGGQINWGDHWGEDCRDVTTTKLQCHVHRMEVIVKMKKNRGGGGGGGGGGSGGMCTKNGSYCEKEKKMKKTKRYGHSGRVGEAFEKIINNFFLFFIFYSYLFIYLFIYFFFFWGGGGGGSGQGIERRSEAFVKFQKKNCWRWGGGRGGGGGQ